MGRPPIGKVAMTVAERVWRHRHKDGTAKPVTKPVTKPASAAPDALAQAKAQWETERTALKDKLTAALYQIMRLEHQHKSLKHEVETLKAKVVKRTKVKLDPETEAAQEVERVKAVNASLRKQNTKLRNAIPFSMRAKIAKALTESQSTPALRKATLQQWNALGLNTIF